MGNLIQWGKMSRILLTAMSQYGIKEIPGEKNNPEIIKYFDIVSDNDFKWTDETAWCSAFMNWVCITSGKKASYALNARSWLGVGHPITYPTQGDVVIYWRGAPDDWRGHVGIYIAEDNGLIYTLGGNQGNMVKISSYPKERVLGYRRV